MSLVGLAGPARLGKFVDFDWRERPEVQAAQVAAARQAYSVVTEGHLLSGSSKRRQIRRSSWSNGSALNSSLKPEGRHWACMISRAS